VHKPGLYTTATAQSWCVLTSSTRFVHVQEEDMLHIICMVLNTPCEV
jgi:hypothetical protein